MQNSELYRRGIVVPLTEASQMALKNNVVERGLEVEFCELPSEEIFLGLWDKGLFETINAQLGSMLDDYEEEIIENKKVPMLRTILKKFEKSSEIDFIERKIVLEIIRLCDVAIKLNRSLFFIL
ncbi:MAG: hypothetical protein RJQ09_09160 [Cyclobacteriaceae bacterium]